MLLAAEIIWIVALLVIVLGLTPPILVLCIRLTAASARIDRLFRETLTAAQGVASGTQHVAALEDTIAVAGGILQTAGSIDQHTGAIETVLLQRLKGGA